MNVLMVGAGAVGQVYGYHLVQGGATLTFLVKPKYADDLRAGLTLYPLNRRDRTKPVLFRDYSVITSEADAGLSTYDQVWISISSTALRSGWLPQLAPHLGDAAVVSLQPGIDDRDYMLQHVRESRLVNGGIYLISYQAPLPGETRFPQPGIAYWFPPLTASPFEGPRPLVAEVVATLKSGGQPTKASHGFRDGLAFSIAQSSPLLAALELSGWKFADLRRGKWLSVGIAAAQQATAISAGKLGRAAPLGGKAINALTLPLGLGLSRYVIPLDIETYLQYHFTKVGDQTRLYLGEFVNWGKAAQLPVDAIEQLLAGLK